MNPQWYEIQLEYDALLVKPDKTAADQRRIEEIEIALSQQLLADMATELE